MYKSVFWDFDGVWSKDRFYKSLKTSNPDVYSFIQTNIFGPNSNTVKKWMQGKLTYNDINEYISKNTGFNLDKLTNTFINDVNNMDIEKRHIYIVNRLKNKGVKVGVITDNMDVFDSITVPRLKFNKLFGDNIFSSFKYKKLKVEGLFDIAINSGGLFDYKSSLLIDNSQKACTAFDKKGGNTYLYSTFEDFEIWANKNLI